MKTKSIAILITALLFTTTSAFSQKDSLSLYLFLLDDCPICIQYTPTLNEMYKTYGNRVSFIGYFPNFSSKKEKIEDFKNQFKVAFPLYTDYFKTQAKKYNATVTPEAVLYNHTKNTVVYQGRIDNMFAKLGKRRKVVTEYDLENALINTLRGQPIENVYKTPVGCYINYDDNINRNE